MFYLKNKYFIIILWFYFSLIDEFLKYNYVVYISLTIK